MVNIPVDKAVRDKIKEVKGIETYSNYLLRTVAK